MQTSHRQIFVCATVVWAALNCAHAAAQLDASPRRLTATRTTGSIVIDGRLDEPDWQRAPVASDFIQNEPSEGANATETTEVRVLYDDRILYVGAFAHHRDPREVVVNELKRDFDGASTDWMAVILDTFHDRRNGYQFGVNPAGATWDSQKFNEGRERNLTWDGAWVVRTVVTDRGWYAEYAIPFRTLQIPHADRQTWGINFQRHLQGRLENSFWAPVPRQHALDRLSLAGTLDGLENIKGGANLRVKPYALARSRQGGNTDPQRDFEAGVDVKYGITSSLTADLSLNTDFSQVEADVKQVGATRFSVLFPEKREFFLENSGIFQFGPGNARARLVTAAPGTSAGGRDNSVQNDLALFFSRRIGLSDSGEILPLHAGARLSGRVGHTSLGVLHVRQGHLGDDPGAAFSVARVRRNMSGSSDVGFALLDRQNGDSSVSRVAGVDVNARPLQDLLIYSYAVKTLDGTDPAPTGRTTAARAGVTWVDRSWVFDASYGFIGANFEDEIGFVPRSGIERRQALLGRHFRPRRFARWLRDVYPVAGITDVRRESGEFDSRYGEYRLLVTLQDGATVEIGANPNDEDLSTPFIVNARRGIEVPADHYQFTDWFIAVSSSRSRRLAWDGRVSTGRYYGGDRQVIQAGISARLNTRLSGSLSLTRDAVDLATGCVKTHLVAARLNYGFSTRAFLHALVQHDSDAHRWDTNVRFNFIHHPLSDLFVVLGERRDARIGRAPDRSVTVKLTRLVNF